MTNWENMKKMPVEDFLKFWGISSKPGNIAGILSVDVVDCETCPIRNDCTGGCKRTILRHLEKDAK